MRDFGQEPPPPPLEMVAVVAVPLFDDRKMEEEPTMAASHGGCRQAQLPATMVWV